MIRRIGAGSYVPAKKIKVDGHTFDSRREAERYGQLRLRLMARNPAVKIKDLEVHPRLPMVVNGRKIGRDSHIDGGDVLTPAHRGLRVDVDV